MIENSAVNYNFLALPGMEEKSDADSDESFDIDKMAADLENQIKKEKSAHNISGQ